MNRQIEKKIATDIHQAKCDSTEADYSHQEWPRDFDFRQSRSEQQELLPPPQRRLPGMRWQQPIERF